MNVAEQVPAFDAKRPRGGRWRLAVGYLLPTPIVVTISVLAALVDEILIERSADLLAGLLNGCAASIMLFFGGTFVGYVFFLPLNLAYTLVMEFAVNRRAKKDSSCVAVSSGLGLICGFLIRDLWWLYIVICPIAGFVSGVVLRRHYRASNPEYGDNESLDRVR